MYRNTLLAYLTIFNSQSKIGQILAPVVHALDVVAETSGYANVLEMSGAISGQSDSIEMTQKRRNSKRERLVRFQTFFCSNVYFIIFLLHRAIFLLFVCLFPAFNFWLIPAENDNFCNYNRK
jgi:hypothetical protein